MTKKHNEKWLNYEPPKGSIFYLGNNLSLLKQSFSMNANGEDWNNGELLENSLDDDLLGEDWDYGGGLMHD